MMNKEEEVDLIIKVLEHPACFAVDLFTLLYIRSHCDGYEVSWEEDGVPISNIKCKHKNFSSLKEAAQFFIDKRYELEMGMDFEIAGMKAQLMKDKNE